MHPRLILCAVLLSAASLNAQSLLADLDKAQLAEVERGRQVLTTQLVEGKPWPRVRLYQKVENTSPEEVAAVFFNYQNAKSFIPKVIKSDIAREISSCIVEVDYGIDIPILPDEFYTARNSMVADPDGSYCVSWELVKALQTKASEGNLRIEEWGSGSVIRYTNLVTPGSAMAGLLKIPAIDQMKQTVHAIVRQAEAQKRDYPQKLEKEVQSLQRALEASPPR